MKRATAVVSSLLLLPLGSALFTPYSLISVASAAPGNRSSAGNEGGKQGAYRWTDGLGRVHYGSNPPAGAYDVVSLQGKKFSRYSSDKLLAPYKKFALPHEAEGEEAELMEKLEPGGKKQDGSAREINGRARLKAGKDPKEAGKKIDLPPEEDGLRSHVIADEPVMSSDEQGDIIRCQVLVRNESAIPAGPVTVRFEFEDGSLIPAAGPRSIPPQGKATYSIPEEVLPIHVAKRPVQGAGGEDDLVEAQLTPQPPKVVIRVGAN